jgi:hypothetical protein
LHEGAYRLSSANYNVDLETHEAVFTWTASMQRRWRNAALRSIVRRDTGESYQDFLTKLAQASGIDLGGLGVRSS